LRARAPDDRTTRATLGTRVYSYLRREVGAGCRDTRRVVGDQHLTVDGAKKVGQRRLGSAVRLHRGEKFMDLS
jgi:hypothetical protein